MVSPGAMLQRVSAVLTCRSSTSYTHKLRDAPPSDDRRPVTPPALIINFILDYQLYPNTSHIHPYMCG